ncbi:M57 family metalloprotease [Sphingobacterium pedocola]|uniref:Peptidase metallopeptidase domain-containing protein n=1 Tax=Sphingobacterium pedocola TaxID=2082722 RepID=A0ABR9T290_9SPHI|nr:M57 family metalloprotease [Sphingobacterium pedocola]MBE8719456.1 hypothetical protein [Sphingobacterium pedocola]
MLSSCNKDFEKGLSETANTNLQIDEIVKLGFQRESIVELKKYYLVEGCYLIPKVVPKDFKGSDFKDYIKSLAIDKKAQYRTDYSVSPTVSSSIKIWVSGTIPTGGTDDWRTAVQNAINAYNNVQYVSYHLELTNSSSMANIIIQSDNGTLPDGTLASAYLPNANGNTGSSVFVNLDAMSNYPFSDSEKTYILCHELGHALGLRHSDIPGVSNPLNYLIPGTPTSDPNSIMHSIWSFHTWNDFSSDDKTALRYLFPATPTITGSGAVCSEETYTVVNGHTVILENGNGIATLTNLGGNQYKITRVGSANGKVTLKAIVGPKAANKIIDIGAPDLQLTTIEFKNSANTGGSWCSSHMGNTFEFNEFDANIVYEARLLDMFGNVVKLPRTVYPNSTQDPFGYVPIGWYTFEIKTKHSCGDSDWIGYEIEYVNCN